MYDKEPCTCIENVKMFSLDYLESYVSLMELDKIICDDIECYGIEETATKTPSILYEKMFQAYSAMRRTPWIPYRVDYDAIYNVVYQNSRNLDKNLLSIIVPTSKFASRKKHCIDSCTDITILGEHYGDLHYVVLLRTLSPSHGSIDEVIDMSLKNFADIIGDNSLKNFIEEIENCDPKHVIPCSIKKLTKLVAELKGRKQYSEAEKEREILMCRDKCRIAVIYPVIRFPSTFYISVNEIVHRAMKNTVHNMDIDIYYPDIPEKNKHINILNKLIGNMKKKNPQISFINFNILIYSAEKLKPNYLVRLLTHRLVLYDYIIVVLDIEHSLFDELEKIIKNKTGKLRLLIMGWTIRRSIIYKEGSEQIEIEPVIELFHLDFPGDNNDNRI